MDLNTTAGAAATETSLPAGINHTDLENDGPKAFGDRMGTPAADEKVLWKGRPTAGLLARNAFHAHTLGLYMAALALIGLFMGNITAAIVTAVMAVALVGLLYFLAWFSARSTLYILTDARLIMRIGMAIETRINIPLKQITGAHLRARGGNHGDIALELSGERLLGTLLLWPHVRPRHYAHPQPMLRAVPDAAHLAQLIAEARAKFGAIACNLTEVNEAAPAIVQPGSRPVPVAARVAPALQRNESGFEGAPA